MHHSVRTRIAHPSHITLVHTSPNPTPDLCKVSVTLGDDLKRAGVWYILRITLVHLPILPLEDELERSSTHARPQTERAERNTTGYISRSVLVTEHVRREKITDVGTAIDDGDGGGTLDFGSRDSGGDPGVGQVEGANCSSASSALL